VSVMMHELRIAYELLLDAKRHKQRIADVVLALQDCSRTPPAPGSSPRILGELLLSPFLSLSLSSSFSLSFSLLLHLPLFLLLFPVSTSLYLPPPLLPPHILSPLLFNLLDLAFACLSPYRLCHLFDLSYSIPSSSRHDRFHMHKLHTLMYT
jgi:hypothetical protein